MSVAALEANKVQSLPKLDPARMELTNALLKLLSSGMDAEIAVDIPNMKAFVAENGLAFALLSETGACMLGSDESVDHACEVLDAGDAILQQVEERLGIDIEPVATHPAAQTAFGSEDAIVLHLAHGAQTLLLAIHSDADQRSRWIETAAIVTIDLTSVPVPLTIEFEAAKLPVAEASQIDGGDMLLLPRKLLATWHGGEEYPARHGVVDLIAMTLQPKGTYHDEEESGMSDDETANTQTAFRVPVTVRLPAQYVDATTLAALQAGGSLQLGPVVQGLPVELLVGGRRIASGEIVEIGENFAVLIDERKSSPVNAETTGDIDLSTPISEGA
jgi:flagellar motor switch/type III secretory pathway protein FliN